MLSLRLSSIKSMIPHGANLADIGADHGLLIIESAKEGLIKKGYASDNKVGPYKILEKAIKSSNYGDVIETKLSDGLDDLPDYIDTLVIAGMGGDLILSILDKHIDKLGHIQCFILQANTHIEILRRYMHKHGYMIDKEEIIYDKHYYEIIRFKKGYALYDENDFIYGPLLRREKNFIFAMKYQNRKKEIKQLLQLEISDKKKEELIKELERIDNL